jgi:hypothetical protein
MVTRFLGAVIDGASCRAEVHSAARSAAGSGGLDPGAGGPAFASLDALKRHAFVNFGRDSFGREAVAGVIEDGLGRNADVLDHPSAGYSPWNFLDMLAL